jgi:hypothetical protein
LKHWIDFEMRSPGCALTGDRRSDIRGMGFPSPPVKHGRPEKIALRELTTVESVV